MERHGRVEYYSGKCFGQKKKELNLQKMKMKISSFYVKKLQISKTKTSILSDYENTLFCNDSVANGYYCLRVKNIKYYID